MAGLVDVHTHLTHKKFSGILSDVMAEVSAEMHSVICNGLEPTSNRQIIEWAKSNPKIKPALGIYPIDAVNGILPSDFPFEVKNFDVNEEIKFISQNAEKGKLIAIGECGIDGHWLGEETYSEQEKVFEELINIAKKNNLPVIIHTRKLEKRSIEILHHNRVEKVNFHCFGGKVKLALKASENDDWCFSIPANSRKNQAFAKMLAELPYEKILTETDAPYLSPVQGEINRPVNVKKTIEHLAELRGWSYTKSLEIVFSNAQRLFNL